MVWIGDHFSVFPLLPFEKEKKKKKDKHNDAVPVSNFVSRSICSPQFDAASIKTEQQSLQTEWKVVYGTLRNHHLVALRVELKRSKLCFIFRGYAISKKEKEKSLALLPCAVNIVFALGHPFARTLFGHMSTDLLLLRWCD